MSHHSPADGPPRRATGHTGVITRLWFNGQQNGSQRLSGGGA